MHPNFAQFGALLLSIGFAEEIINCSELMEQKIAECLKPILQYANALQQSSNRSPFSLHGPDVFEHLCSLHSQFKKCVGNKVDCHSVSLEAVEASYGYMCGEGHSHFEKHASCFGIVETQTEYSQCRDAASAAMDDSASLKHSNLKAYFESLCRIMDDYLRCCRPFVVERCGLEAWNLVSQITTDSLHVTMPSCDIHSALL